MGTCLLAKQSRLSLFWKELQPEPLYSGRHCLRKSPSGYGGSALLELHLFYAIGMCFQQHYSYFKDRMTPKK